MRARTLISTLAALALVALLVAPTLAGDDGRGRFRASLTGYEEVPSISTVGEGTFRAEVDGSTIEYKLTYTTETAANAAHIHLGQRSVNGGVSAFLCGGGDKPPCPGTGGTVSGVIDPTDVIGPDNQGIEPGAMNELLAAMRAGVTYANVHSTRFPGGEIRGQILRGGGSD
jgi:CHRD domain